MIFPLEMLAGIGLTLVWRGLNLFIRRRDPFWLRFRFHLTR